MVGFLKAFLTTETSDSSSSPSSRGVFNHRYSLSRLARSHIPEHRLRRSVHGLASGCKYAGVVFAVFLTFRIDHDLWEIGDIVRQIVQVSEQISGVAYEVEERFCATGGDILGAKQVSRRVASIPILDSEYLLFSL